MRKQLGGTIRKLIVAENSELVEELTAAWSQVHQKEAEFQDKEERINKTIAFLSPVYREKTKDGKIEVFVERIFLWRRQALAISRSENHLKTIDKILARAKNSILPAIEISIRDYSAMLQDEREFLYVAFRCLAK